MKYIFPILFLGLLLTNCGDDNNSLTYNEQLEVDEKIIQDYLAENNIDAERGDLGLFYVIEEPGTGDTYPNSSSSVIVNYKGYYPNGDVFDENQGAQFSLQGVITGWRIGIPLFKKGGKGKLFIPSSIGYGVLGSGPIPPNQVLIFDIELINFL